MIGYETHTRIYLTSGPNCVENGCLKHTHRKKEITFDYHDEDFSATLLSRIHEPPR